MGISRRDFVQRSASAAAIAGLGPGATTLSGALSEQTLGAVARARGIDPKYIRAHPLALDRVRVLGGPLKRAQDVTAKYLLSLEPDRMLAFYRLRAGLPQKAEPYAGWDGGGRNLTGHIAGHYLSAVSLMYRATGDEQFKKRADYLVSELKTVQDKHGDGYLSALEKAREAFAEVSHGTSLAHFEPNANATGFYDAKYSVPTDLTRGKSKVTVRFQAAGSGRIAPVFTVRSVRADRM